MCGVWCLDAWVMRVCLAGLLLRVAGTRRDRAAGVGVGVMVLKWVACGGTSCRWRVAGCCSETGNGTGVFCCWWSTTSSTAASGPVC